MISLSGKRNLSTHMEVLKTFLLRAGWILLAVLILTLFMAGIPARYAQLASSADWRSLERLNLPVYSYVSITLALNFFFILSHGIIASVVFVLRKDDSMALLLAYALIANGAILPLSLMYPAETAHPFSRALVNLVVYIGLVTNLFLLYRFPDGRYVPGWTRGMAYLWAIICIPGVFSSLSKVDFSAWQIFLQIAFLLAWPLTGLAAQSYRYFNVSSILQRQQTKWALLGLFAAVIGPFAYFLSFSILPNLASPDVPNVLYQRLGSSFFTFVFMLRLAGIAAFHVFALVFPISFAIAILRYRLWDIDLLIYRALVYSVLTVSLGLIYLSSVVLMQQIFLVITGEGRSEWVSVVSTLALVSMFSPLRRRAQTFIDRRFYRRKYDVEKTLAEFAAALRDEVDLRSLEEDLLQIVDKTMQPESISLWMKKTYRANNSNR